MFRSSIAVQSRGVDRQTDGVANSAQHENHPVLVDFKSKKRRKEIDQGENKKLGQEKEKLGDWNQRGKKVHAVRAYGRAGKETKERQHG